MKAVWKILGGVALLLTIGPACLHLFGVMDLATAKLVMLAGTALWFVTAPLWMGREPDVPVPDDEERIRL